MNNPYEINWKVHEPRPQLPELLYKYRDINKIFHLETLTELTIFLPSPIRFNDPFDCKIPLEYLQLGVDEELRRNFLKKLILMQGSKEQKNKMEYHVADFMAKKYFTKTEELLKLEENDVKKLNEMYGIYSVSAVPNNILLWSHYADSHKGICIGFNAKKLYDTCEFSSVGPVTYFDKYPNMSVLRDNEDLFYNQLYNKSLDWYYEMEYRYAKINSADTKTKFTPDIIEEIYIGCLSSSEHTSVVKQIRKDKFPHARLFKCVKSRQGYYLEIQEI